MSTAATVEIERLARLLRSRPRDLSFLERFAATEIRALRLATFDRMYDDHRSTYARIATASRLLPARLTVPLAQRMLPPRVSAGVVASLPADQAAAMAGRMAVDYVCDVSTYLSPALAEPVLTRMPDEVILQVTLLLRERRDYATMAEIVGALTDEQVVSVVAGIDEVETLVQVALRVTDPGGLDRLSRVLPEDRLHGMVLWARRHPRLWPELASLLGRLPAARRRRLLSAARAG